MEGCAAVDGRVLELFEVSCSRLQGWCSQTICTYYHGIIHSPDLMSLYYALLMGIADGPSDARTSYTTALSRRTPTSTDDAHHPQQQEQALKNNIWAMSSLKPVIVYTLIAWCLFPVPYQIDASYNVLHHFTAHRSCCLHGKPGPHTDITKLICRRNSRVISYQLTAELYSTVVYIGPRHASARDADGHHAGPILLISNIA